jgi:hypothetical protein
MAALNAASTGADYSCNAERERRAMIDNLSLFLSHGLMMLAAILLLRRPDLDREPGPGDKPVKAKRRWGDPDA